MARKPVTDPAFHDASDPRCVDHARSGEPVRAGRQCPKCVPLALVVTDTPTRSKRRRAVRP